MLLADLSLSGICACRLAPWGGVRSGPVRMVLHCGQCHSDRQPFMAGPCTVSSLPPLHRGSRRVANAKGTAKITNTKGATCLSLVWCVVVCVWCVCVCVVCVGVVWCVVWCDVVPCGAVASVGNCEQVHTSVFESYLPTSKCC